MQRAQLRNHSADNRLACGGISECNMQRRSGNAGHDDGACILIDMHEGRGNAMLCGAAQYQQLLRPETFIVAFPLHTEDILSPGASDLVHSRSREPHVNRDNRCDVPDDILGEKVAY